MLFAQCLSIYTYSSGMEVFLHSFIYHGMNIRTPIKNIACSLHQSIFPSQELQWQTGADNYLCTGIYPLKEKENSDRPITLCSLSEEM